MSTIRGGTVRPIREREAASFPQMEPECAAESNLLDVILIYTNMRNGVARYHYEILVQKNRYIAQDKKYKCHRNRSFYQNSSLR